MTDKAKDTKAKAIKVKKVEKEKVSNKLIVDKESLVAAVHDVEIFGNDDWKLLSKAESKEGGWMKSTKALYIHNVGCLVQVTTKNNGNVAEALQMIRGVKIVEVKNKEGIITSRSLKKA